VRQVCYVTGADVHATVKVSWLIVAMGTVCEVKV
jgi:hypothetical protein